MTTTATTTKERPMKNAAILPVPSSKHATCAWCRTHFDSIVELLDHVDNGHTDAPANPRPQFELQPAA